MKTYRDIAGDGGSRVVEQVEARRAEIARRLAGVRTLVAIASGKGGVGKSTLTLQLARALRRRGHAAGVFDADFNGPTQARLAGLRNAVPLPGPAGTLPPRTADGIAVVSLGGLVPEEQALEFPSAATGDSYTWRGTREFALLSELLAGLDWGALDVLLFDLPPGAERTRQFAEFLGPRARFVLVTIPTDVSRGVVARSLAALQAAGATTLGYVENMAGYACAGCNEVRPLFPEGGEVRLPLRCLGRVPFDPDLAALCDAGRPLADPAGPAASPAARAIDALAADLLAALETLP